MKMGIQDKLGADSSDWIPFSKGMTVGQNSVKLGCCRARRLPHANCYLLPPRIIASQHPIVFIEHKQTSVRLPACPIVRRLAHELS